MSVLAVEWRSEWTVTRGRPRRLVTVWRSPKMFSRCSGPPRGVTNPAFPAAVDSVDGPVDCQAWPSRSTSSQVDANASEAPRPVVAIVTQSPDNRSWRVPSMRVRPCPAVRVIGSRGVSLGGLASRATSGSTRFVLIGLR
jgi:hypothetical protein